MGLQRTPPKSTAVAPILPRPLPPAYPEGEEPPSLSSTSIHVDHSGIPAEDGTDDDNVHESGGGRLSERSGRKRPLEVEEDEVDSEVVKSRNEERQEDEREEGRATKRQSLRPFEHSAGTEFESESAIEDTPVTEAINANLEASGLVTLSAPSAPLEDRHQPQSFSTRTSNRRRSAQPQSASADVPLEEEDKAGEEEDESNVDFGKGYQTLLQALEVAVRKGANKWTAKDFKQCFPTISTSSNERAEFFDTIWERTAKSMRETMLDHAVHLLSEYKSGPGLLRLQETIAQAKEDAKDGVRRPDAWRPNLTPQALMAATNLPQYDAEYTRLREEYVELVETSAHIGHGLAAKAEKCQILEAEVKESIEQLEKTVEILHRLPTDEIREWMTDVAGNLEGQREP